MLSNCPAMSISWHCGEYSSTMQIWDCFKIDSKSTLGGTLCVFGSHTFIPTSWMCKKQTCVSHSSTKSENISLDEGLRMGGIPALDFWDLIIDVMHSDSNQRDKQARRIPSRCEAFKKQLNSQIKAPVFFRDVLNCPTSVLFPQK